jgi:hypothetical protein
VRAVVCAWLVAAACGDNIYEMEPDELSGAYSAAVCRYWVRCGLVRDIVDCEQIYRYRVHPDLTAALDARVVDWQAEIAQQCVDHIDQLSCDPTDDGHRVPACFGIYTGTKHDGEPCAFGTECISRECWKESIQCTDACCIGVCTGDTAPPIGRIGDRCRYSPCAEGYCKDSLCVPLLAAGAQCGFDDVCGIGLTCDSGVCKVLPGPGERCTVLCRDIGDVCGSLTAVCERGGFKGDACSGNALCSPIYICSADHKYSCQPPVQGDRCFGTRCALPLVCDTRTATCIEPKPDGSECWSSGDCASGSCSNVQTCTSERCI